MLSVLFKLSLAHTCSSCSISVLPHLSLSLTHTHIYGPTHTYRQTVSLTCILCLTSSLSLLLSLHTHTASAFDPIYFIYVSPSLVQPITPLVPTHTHTHTLPPSFPLSMTASILFSSFPFPLIPLPLFTPHPPFTLRFLSPLPASFLSSKSQTPLGPVRI